MRFRVELEHEDDGSYTAEVMDLPGVIVSGETAQAALDRAAALALHVIADRIEHGEIVLDEGPLAVAFDIVEPAAA